MSTNSSVTSSDWLKSATKRLTQRSISSAYLDSVILLEDQLKVDRSNLITEPNIALTSNQLSDLEYKLERRLKYEPLAYIRGYIEFYGRRFFVKPGVFIPRIESEEFIEIVKSLDLGMEPRVIDVGCGSGCLGITLKLELPNATVELIDISKIALEVTNLNAKKLEAKVKITNSNLSTQSYESYNLVIANLPYVPNNIEINLDAKFEPSRAIYGGTNGLDWYELLFNKVKEHKKHPSFILTESLLAQHTSLTKLAEAHGYRPYKTMGLVKVFVSDNR